MELNMTIEEVNIILQALGNAPYAQVADLVQKIRKQAIDQLPKQENTGS